MSPRIPQTQLSRIYMANTTAPYTTQIWERPAIRTYIHVIWYHSHVSREEAERKKLTEKRIQKSENVFPLLSLFSVGCLLVLQFSTITQSSVRLAHSLSPTPPKKKKNFHVHRYCLPHTQLMLNCCCCFLKKLKRNLQFFHFSSSIWCFFSLQNENFVLAAQILQHIGYDEL